MVVMVIVVSGIGYGIARGVRYYKKQQKRGLLEAPINLLDEFKKPARNDMDQPTEQENVTSRNRYTKAQARQRFKKGKT